VINFIQYKKNNCASLKINYNRLCRYINGYFQHDQQSNGHYWNLICFTQRLHYQK